MRCPQCDDLVQGVIDSRTDASNEKGRANTPRGVTRRRRECASCGHRFNTIETTQARYNELIELERRLASLLEAVS